MKKQSANTSEERKMKFAEAGILFVLVLALTVFVGVRMASHDDQDAVVTVARATIVEPVVPEPPTPAPVAVVEPVEVVEPVAETTPALAAEPPRIVSYALAEQTYFDGDYVKAGEQFEAYTAAHAENAWGYYMLGLSNWKAGDLDGAATAFQTALELKPDHVKSLINYGRVLLEQDQPAAARVQIELALQQAPENIDANRMFSRICHSEGDLDAAADGYLKVLRNNVDDVWSLNNLGLIRIQQGRFTAALAPLARAAGLQPDVACIQNNLGVALERTGHLAAATDAYEMALSADADYAKADESLDRVSGLPAAAESDTIDLARLAASFPTDSAATGNEITEVSGDMDVATTLIVGEEDQDPELQ